jgi:hypothetical protein
MDGYALRPVDRGVSRSGFLLPLLGALVVALVAGALLYTPAHADDWDPTPEPTATATVTPTATPTATPTPTPTATPEPARARPATRGGRGSLRELAARHFPPGSVDWAVTTALCESGGDTGAYSSGYDRRYGYYEHVGAWQIAGSWRAKARDLFGGELEDPETNAAMAAWILSVQGRGAWPTCGFVGGW